MIGTSKNDLANIIHSVSNSREKCNFAQKIDYMSRTTTIFIACLAFLMAACSGGKKNEDPYADRKGTVNNNLPAGKITIGASEESYDLAQRLASTYVSENTNIIIDVIPFKPEELEKALSSGMVQMIVTSGSTNPIPDTKATLIATDVLVVAVNFNGNPCIQNLAIRGLDLKELQGIFTSGSISNWNQIDKKAVSTPIKPLAAPESGSAYAVVKAFLKGNFTKSTTAAMSENELLNSMIVSPGNIAFISHLKAFDLSSGLRAKGIYIIPVDINGNNLADDKELVYDDLGMLKKAYNSGKFPKELVRNHYLITKDNVERADIVKHFSGYVVKNGKDVVSTCGYFEPLKK